MKFIFYYIKDLILKIGARWDELAVDKKSAIDFAQKHINQEPKRVTDAGQYSMEYCLAHSGVSINDRYRHDCANEIDEKIAEMVAEHATDIDLILYRGVCDSVYKFMKSNAKDKSGCDFYEKGFLATSLVKGYEYNYKIKLRIYVPAGTKVIYQGNVDDEQELYEVDVMHGSKLKIISIDSEYINCRLIETA